MSPPLQLDIQFKLESTLCFGFSRDISTVVSILVNGRSCEHDFFAHKNWPMHSFFCRSEGVIFELSKGGRSLVNKLCCCLLELAHSLNFLL